MESASKRITRVEKTVSDGFQRQDGAVELALSEAPSISLRQGLGVAIITAARAATWASEARSVVSRITTPLLVTVKAASDALTEIENEVKAVHQLADFLAGKIADVPEHLEPSIAAAAETLRRADPTAAAMLAAQVIEAGRAVAARVERAKAQHEVSRAASEVARHRAASRIHTAAGQDRSVKAATILAERAGIRLQAARQAQRSIGR